MSMLIKSFKKMTSSIGTLWGIYFMTLIITFILIYYYQSSFATAFLVSSIVSLGIAVMATLWIYPNISDNEIYYVGYLYLLGVILIIVALFVYLLQSPVTVPVPKCRRVIECNSMTGRCRVVKKIIEGCNGDTTEIIYPNYY